jgi:cytochrome P450
VKYMPDWMPGAGFKKIAKRYRYNTEKFYDDPFNFAKSQMVRCLLLRLRPTLTSWVQAAGTAVPSMTYQLLEDGVDDARERAVQDLVGALFGGASDTTPAALAGFVLAMVLYPDVQKKAQEELDRVVGSDRLPLFSDRPSLPYMEALAKEVGKTTESGTRETD